MKFVYAFCEFRFYFKLSAINSKYKNREVAIYFTVTATSQGILIKPNHCN